MNNTPAKLVTRPLPKTVHKGLNGKKIEVSNREGTTYKPKNLNENPNNQLANMLGRQTDFSGEARVAQVLRWTSTSALIANDIFKDAPATNRNRAKAANTPEAQSTVIGGRLIIGTNADNDSHIPAQLQQLLANKSKVNSTVEVLQGESDGYAMQALFAENDKGRDKFLESSRISDQQARHLSQLHQFVSEDNVFRQVSGQMRQEIFEKYEIQNADTTGSANNYLTGLKQQQQSSSSMLRSLRSSLKSGGSFDMATNVDGRHAEQRIVEDVLANHDKEVEHTKIARGFTIFSTTPVPDELNMIVAGTKPPCAMCEVTEQSRQQVVESNPSEKSPLVMRRFKDEHYQTGNLFPGEYTNTEDVHVHSKMKDRFDSPVTFPKTHVTARKRANSVANIDIFK